MRLMRFPGDPAIPAPSPLAHSLVLGELLAYDVAETASRSGEVTGWSVEDRLEGVVCGATTGDGYEESSFGVEALLGTLSAPGPLNFGCPRHAVGIFIARRELTRI